MIRGRINWTWPPMRRENADATVRIACQIAIRRPVVTFFNDLIKSTALSFKPLRSHSPITGRVRIKRVAVRLVIKAVPRVSRISSGLMPATRPVARPAVTTTARVSSLSINPAITMRTPISFTISIQISLLNKCAVKALFIFDIRMCR